MASASRLCYGPMPANQPCLASGIRRVPSRPSSVHLSLCKRYHFLSNCSKNRRVALPVWRVNCMLENSSFPPKNEENENKIARGMAGISLVLACVLGVFSFQGMMKPKSATAYASSFVIPSTSSQEDSLASIVRKSLQTDVERAVDMWVEMIKHDSSPCPQLPDMPSQKDIEELKLYALGLSKSGKPQDALKLLYDAYNKCEGQAEAEHFLNMALVELLILQRNYKEAGKWLDGLIMEERLSEEDKINLLEDDPVKFLNADIFLYKAVVLAMLKQKEEALKWWIAFKSLPSSPPLPSLPPRPE